MPFKEASKRVEYHKLYYREHKEEFQNYYDKSREKINQRRNDRYKAKREGLPSRRITHGKTNTPQYLLYCGAKKRAKKSGVPFDLSVDDIPEIPLVCPVLGIEIKSGNGRMIDNSPTLDRIKPKLGYIKTNVRIISWRANNLKRDATTEELRSLLEDALRIESK